MRNVVICVIVGLAASMVITSVKAQAPAAQFSAAMPQGSLTGCPSPVAGFNTICSVTDGVYISVGTGSYTKLGATATGVTSFNGRTGVVTLSKSDVVSSGVTVTSTVSSTLQ